MTALWKRTPAEPCNGGHARECGKPGTWRVGGRPLCDHHVDDGLVLALTRAMELGLRKRGRLM